MPKSTIGHFRAVVHNMFYGVIKPCAPLATDKDEFGENISGYGCPTEFTNNQ